MKIKHILQIAITFTLVWLFGTFAAIAADNVIKIGAPLPLTGPLSPEGLKQKQGYDLWAEVVNKKGGINADGKSFKVEIVYVDYASNTSKAVQSADRLITQDKVNFLFSPFGSGAAKAAGGVSEKYGIPTIAATASSEAVYNQGYKYLFGTFTPNKTLTEPLANLVLGNKPDVKRVAILSRNDLFPTALAKEMDKSAKKRKLDVVMFEKYAIGTLDHSSTVTQIKASKPDWVFATGYINDLILIRKQMKDLGVSAEVVTMIAGPAYQEFIDASQSLAENVTSSAWWHPAVRYDGKGVFGKTENFNKLFQAKYGISVDYVHASAAAAGVILQLAIEDAGTIDPKKVRDSIAGLNTTTFYGPIKFGSTGQISSLEPPVFQIKSGKPVVIYPKNIKQDDMDFGIK